MSLKGSCYCGEIEYTVDDDGDRTGVACLCRTCQKLHTSASYNAKSEVGKVHVTKGSPKVYDDNKADSNKAIHRYFCGNCGSALWSDPESMPGVRFLKLGPLDNAKDFKLGAEIYVESALPHTLNDKSKFGQKQFEGMMAKEV
ncbi:hypothetical protein P389DRAFT_197757 [Cystobasidium minutum MCA 4210]|uniref:uncharacterized protein n=1 Tax=Cystobasidium minutum MCA 4210 TaxID=1397322 RepID=UPI0034CE5EDE|eukprot:jgi/Rhomi1/197757/gm1.5971_g